jgi:hypothetical protein
MIVWHGHAHICKSESEALAWLNTTVGARKPAASNLR